MSKKILPNAKAGDAYHLDPTFEADAATLCATSPSFWSRIGHAIDPECLSDDAAKTVIRACRQIAHETHRGPESFTIVLQHIRRWMDEGKKEGALPKHEAVVAMFANAQGRILPSEDAAAASLKPILARRIRDEAVDVAIEEGGKDGDFSRVKTLIDKANRLGDREQEVEHGAIRLSDVKAEAIRWLWRGRVPFGKVTIVEGDPGKGKSTLVLDLAARVTTGAPMPLEDERDDPAGVVLVSVEDGIADVIRPRLEAAGGDATRVLIPFRDRVPSLLDPRDLDAIENAIGEDGAKLVVLDPLSALLGGKVDAHKDQDVRRVLAPLARDGGANAGSLRCRAPPREVERRHVGDVCGHREHRHHRCRAFRAARVAVDPEHADRRVLAPVKSNVSRLSPKLLRFEDPGRDHGRGWPPPASPGSGSRTLRPTTSWVRAGGAWRARSRRTPNGSRRSSRTARRLRTTSRKPRARQASRRSSSAAPRRSSAS